eukprot:350758-Rhodomonas_salina.2
MAVTVFNLSRVCMENCDALMVDLRFAATVTRMVELTDYGSVFADEQELSILIDEQIKTSSASGEAANMKLETEIAKVEALTAKCCSLVDADVMVS